MAKTASERVKAAQKKAADAGAERLTLTLYGEDADRWRDWLARYDGHGAKMQAFRDALAAATVDEITPEQAARIIARHFKVRA